MKHLPSLFLLTLFFFRPSGTLFSQEKENVVFHLDFEIGTQTFNEPDSPTTYQHIGLTPILSIAQFQAALDLTLHFNIAGGENGDQFIIREQDWVPDGPSDILPAYLPKIRYIQWAEDGDPLYARYGRFSEVTFGNGFIVSDYTNTRLLPEQPIAGLLFDLDGALFSFPYIGIETVIANLAVFDVMGGRLYGLPFNWTDVPIIGGIEIGITAAGDRKPFYHTESTDNDNDGPTGTENIFIIGGDLSVPIVQFPFFTLALLGDIGFENGSAGGAVGIQGTIIETFPFRGEIRFLGDNFIPVYFDSTYDLYRPLRYTLISKQDPGPDHVGWLIRTGLTLFDDNLGFTITIDGPFQPPEPENSDNYTHYPHLRGEFYIREPLVPGIGVSIFYDKRYLREFKDFASEEGTVFGTTLSLRIGPAFVSLHYGIRFNTNLNRERPWETTSGIVSSIRLF